MPPITAGCCDRREDYKWQHLKQSRSVCLTGGISSRYTDSDSAPGDSAARGTASTSPTVSLQTPSQETNNKKHNRGFTFCVVCSLGAPHTHTRGIITDNTLLRIITRVRWQRDNDRRIVRRKPVVDHFFHLSSVLLFGRAGERASGVAFGVIPKR